MGVQGMAYRFEGYATYTEAEQRYNELSQVLDARPGLDLLFTQVEIPKNDTTSRHLVTIWALDPTLFDLIGRKGVHIRPDPITYFKVLDTVSETLRKQ